MKPVFDNSILEELKKFCDETESAVDLIKGRFKGYYLFHYSPTEITFLYRNENRKWTHIDCHTMEEYKSNFFLLKKQYFELKEKDMIKRLERIDKDF